MEKNLLLEIKKASFHWIFTLAGKSFCQGFSEFFYSISTFLGLDLSSKQ